MNCSFSDFIYIADNALEPDFCQSVIEKFENDRTKCQGVIGVKEKIDLNIKDSTDLFITNKENWKEEDRVFYESLKKHNSIYSTDSPWIKIHSPHRGDVSDSGYQIQRTFPGSGYTWHVDSMGDQWVENMGVRWMTYIWYLNDIDEGGYTEFIDGTKVQPRQGRICLFPATWTYIHRGYPPTNQTKYLATGWMYQKA